MKLTSCYKVLASHDRTNGGIGQGGGGYHTEILGIELQKRVAAELGATLVLQPRLHGSNAFNGGDYEPPDTADIAYCQLFECPTRRPADFVYTMISDYIGAYRDYLEIFLATVRPNLVISLQYPLEPPPFLPTVPQLGMLPNLVEQCAAYGCQVVYLPWPNAYNVAQYNPAKTITGMCTGKMSGTYPFRDAAYRLLQSLNRPDVVLSGNASGSTFKLSDEEYRAALASTKYYVTGGIYDLQIPPKSYEVANYGACLITNDMPMLRESGFVHGETCLVAKSVDEIPAILETDAWQDIAPKAQQMVHRRHSLEQRARDIVKVYRGMTGR